MPLDFGAALFGIPFGIFTNYSYSKINELEKYYTKYQLEDLFVNSFIKSIECHINDYDEYGKNLLTPILKLVKRDKTRLLSILIDNLQGENNILTIVNRDEYRKNVAMDIFQSFQFEGDSAKELTIDVVADCFNYYTSAFFNEMTEKEGLSIVLQEVIKISSTLDTIALVNKNTVTHQEFEQLRKYVFKEHYRTSVLDSSKLKEYDDYLVRRYGEVELRGLSPKIQGQEISIKLEDIYVPARLIKINEFNQMKSEGAGSKLIVNSQDLIESEENNNEVLIDDILNHKYAVILGDPGSGKSTLLKYLILYLMKLRGTNHTLENIIPIYLRISEYADYRSKENVSITLHDYIMSIYDRQFKDIFELGFNYSNVLLLLDGLDEITDTALRIRVVDQVNDLVARYSFNRYIITTRIVGYQEARLGNSFQHFMVQDFNEEDIKLFAENWYSAIAHSSNKDKDYIQDQSNKLYGAISRNQSVVRLGTNPLLMTIIAMIHHQGRKIPNKRAELYDICTSTFLENWVQLRVDSDSKLKDKDEIIEMLSPIAFEMHKNSARGIIDEIDLRNLFIKYYKIIRSQVDTKEALKEYKEFNQFVSEDAGFFYEKGNDFNGNTYFGFIHLTFEEYMASIELISQWEAGELDLLEYIFDARWIEVIRLAAAQIKISNKGRIGRTKVTSFLNELLSVKDPFPEAYRPHQLVCLILADDVEVLDESLFEILNLLCTILETTQYPMLIETYTKLVQEMLLGDIGDTLINRVKEDLFSEVPQKEEYALKLFANCTNDSRVNELLKQFYENKEYISPELFEDANYKAGFAQSYCSSTQFLRHFRNYLLSRNPSYTKISSLQYFNLLEPNNILRLRGNVDIEKLNTSLEKLDHDIYPIILRKIIDHYLDMSLCEFSHTTKSFEILSQLVNKNSHSHSKNAIILINNLKEKAFKKDFNSVSRLFSRFYINDFFVFYSIELPKEEEPQYKIYMWNGTYSQLICLIFNGNNYQEKIQELSVSIEYEVSNILEILMYIILGPGKFGLEEDFRTYMKMINLGIAEPFGIWDNFAINELKNEFTYMKNIILKKRNLDKIPKKNPFILEEDNLYKSINLESLYEVAVSSENAPLQYLYQKLTGAESNISTIQSLIKYYYECEEDRIGTFNFLYPAINPYKFLSSK